MIGINGLGRVGRCVLKQLLMSGIHSCCIINEPNMSVKNIEYLLNHDTIYGKSQLTFIAKEQSVITCAELPEVRIHCFHEADILKPNWSQMGATLIIDSSGVPFSDVEIESVIRSGVKHILFTNLRSNTDCIFVYGYSNPSNISCDSHTISLGTCDSAAIAPVIQAIQSLCSIKSLSAVTLHPWLNYQNLLDGTVDKSVNYPNCEDCYYQLGRQAFDNLIPKPTSLTRVLTELFPDLQEKIQIMAYRIPTDTVSVADLFLTVEKTISLEEVCKVLNQIPNEVIGKNHELLVSKDFCAMSQAGMIDFNWISICENTIHITIWYDNEWGYASAVLKTLSLLDK